MDPTPDSTTERRRPSPILRSIAYPLVLAAGALLCAAALGARLDLSRLVLVVFGVVMALLIVLERLIPYRTDWHPDRGEVVRDGVYLGLGVVFGGTGQLLASLAALAVATGDNDLPLWLAAPLAVLLADLGTYGFHRFVHRNRWMWREHGIHHVTDKVNTLNANTAHFLDIVLNNVAAYGPLLMLGFCTEAVFVVTVARVVQTFGAHANIDVRLGWLGYVVMGPEHHRLHHSVDPADAGNYGTVLTLWDRVFGTLCWSPGRTTAQVGVRPPHRFPASHRIVASALHPFGRREPRAPAG